MNKLKLTKSLFLAKGGERDCYIHPNDNKKIIKVLHLEGTHNNQNKLEFLYNNYLEKKKVSFEHITKCYGWVETDKGKGLVFQRVLDYNNTDTKTFRYYVRNHLLSNDIEIKLLDELNNYLKCNNILFIDVSLANVFCQKISRNKYKLIIFDGLGGRRTGIKFNLYLKIHFFTKYKIKKQWNKFISNFNKDKNYMLNQQS